MNSDSLKRIEDIINENDLVLVVDESDKHISLKWIKQITNFITILGDDRKVIVLSSDEYKDMLSLFYTYEFTDKLKIIGKSNQYGGLQNFVEAGLMTEKEFLEVVLR